MNPEADSFNQPFASLRLVMAVEVAPSCSVTEISAFTGADVKL